MSEAKPKGLAAKLLDAQRSVDAVVKRGRNVDQKYAYATAADVIQVSRQALHDAGLLPAIHSVEITNRRPFQTKSGTAGLHVEVGVTLRITDPESGEAMESPAIGAGADYGGGDKAALKGQTAATKYAYANALALPFADFEPEKDAPGEAGRLPEQKADPATALPDADVTELAKLYGESGFDFGRLCMAIGSVGGEAPKINRKDSIRKSVASLTAAQAIKLGNVLDAAAKERAKKAKAEKQEQTK